MARIFQTPVAPLFPLEGPVQVLLFGEAPGPLGADKSGIPFWGDRAGLVVYRALEAAGLARVPAEAYADWDGARLKANGLVPIITGVALSNAYPSCPTRDGQTFKAPTDRELAGPENLARIGQELTLAASRCPGRLRVIALGKRAQWLFQRIEGAPVFDLVTLPHPSAQGLLQAAPGKGKGLRLADLQAAWEARLEALLSM
ncbi:MAG: uracil-DNA glycosylase family protein [Holophaga sp.]